MLTDHTIVYAFIFYLLTAGSLFLTRKKLDDSLAGIISIFINFLGLLFTLEIMARYIEPSVTSWKWFQVGDHLITLDILINPLTLLMLFLVQSIGLLVQLYSYVYLKGDLGYIRFFAYINLFLAAMLGIVTAGNLWQTFLFWELVGVASYLLIGFWYQRPAANSASLKAFLINRIGDVGFLIGLFWIYGLAGTWEYTALQTWWNNPEHAISPAVQNGIAFCFLWAALGKSAQFPLQIWLPDAMEGPTPASALIHAATMVVAGIFLLARLDFLLPPLIQFLAILIGLFTALIGALSACVQWEIKKVLAYSTISQLGLMLVGIGTGYASAALFHLLTHAFFKAGLFLAAGQVIHHFHHQDMQRMGGLLSKRPYLFLAYGICAAGLAGLPFFAGFLSKDTLLLGLYAWAKKEENPYFMLLPGVFLLVSSMTAYYAARHVYLIFLNRTNQSLRTDILLLFRRTTSEVKGRIDLLLASQKDDEIVTGETFLQRLQSMGMQDLVVGLLALGSFYFLVSSSPFHAEGSWFYLYFPLPDLHHPYIPVIAAGVSIISALVGYELTKKIAQNPSDSHIQRWVRNHFYLDALWYALWVRPWFKVVSLTEENAEIEEKSWQPEGGLRWFRQIDKMALDGILRGLSYAAIQIGMVMAWVDHWIIDGLVRAIYQGAQWLGSYTKRIQGGQVQAYFAAMILFILALIGLLVLV